MSSFLTMGQPPTASTFASTPSNPPLPALAAALVLAAGAACAALIHPVHAAAQSEQGSADAPHAAVPELYRELAFRSIGPAVTGGRIHDIEALPFDPSTIYVAAATGGIWKSTNKGTTWTPIFDHQENSTFGDLAIAPSDPDVVWAGTGEQNNRQSTSWGSGVYRSTDAGKTWTHLGLVNTRHIGRIVVDPADPDHAWVAAQGNLWAPGRDRGVFVTRDGGRNWQKTLYVDTLTGATDLAMDACDPNTLYAATYQRLRRTWGFNGGGPGSGIWKSTDGGETWRRMEQGLPSGDKGRIGLAAAASMCGIVDAIVEHPDSGGVYRTEDGGARWTRMSDRDIRPSYYSAIYIDPSDADRVYTLATYSGRSEDGGRTWTDVSGRLAYDVGVHSDHHAMWIDPRNPDHYYLGGDGGLYETWDRGATYIRLNNIPVAQAYAIGADMRDPYWLYVGLQDNHSWMGPSATRHWAGILAGDWRQIGFSDGMYQQADPTSAHYIDSNNENGGYTRVDAFTGDRMDIRPVPPEGEPDYRFDWVAPSLLSPHDPKTFYVGGNRLFISHDRGATWARSPDLTRQVDRDTLALMGVTGADITLSKNDGTESYGEIVTIAESPVDSLVLWVGADDGSLVLSRDGGDTWTRVDRNVSGLPAGTYVSRVIGSRFGAAIAYATFDAHCDGDFAPYVFGTDDFGRTWTPLVAGLDPEGSVNVILEHPDNPHVLFLGTEHALWVSTDAGASWQRFGANLPTTAYDDLLIHPREGDLVAATHGRGLWILDDALPVALAAAARDDVALFPVRSATLRQYWKDTSYRGMADWTGENPPEGAIIDYRLAAPSSDARIVITRGGDTVRTLHVSGDAGVIHRVVWDLRYAPVQPEAGPAAAPVAAEGREAEPMPHPLGPRGPFVSPGTYTVTLESGGAHPRQDVMVRGDPLMPMLGDEDYRARERFLLGTMDIQRRAAAAATTRDGDAARAALGRVRREAAALFREVDGGGVQPGTLYPATAGQQRRLERLRARLAELEGGRR